MSILLKRNDNPGIAPSPEELIPGEIALNTADSALYTKNQDGEIVLLASAADLPPPSVVSWSNITGKPSAFTPSAHTHSPSDITGTAVITTDSRLSDNRDPNPHSHSWTSGDITNGPSMDNNGDNWRFVAAAQTASVEMISHSANYFVRVSEGGPSQTIGTLVKGPLTLTNSPGTGVNGSITFPDATVQTTAYTGLVAHTHPTSEINGLDTTIGEIQVDISALESGKQDAGDYALSNHNHGYDNELTHIGYNAGLNTPTIVNPDGISSRGITSVGYESCLLNDTGYQNSALGYRSLSLNTSGFFNSAFGSLALENSTTGYFNNAFGGASLRNNTTGTANIGIGTGALYYNTTGTANIALGHNALPTNTVGSYNIIIGASSDVASSNIDRSIVIGTGAVAQRTGDLVIASTTHPVVVSTTVGAAGTAANLPTRPLGYLEVRLNGILVKIPYYQV